MQDRQLVQASEVVVNARPTMGDVATLANEIAQRKVLTDYQGKRAPETLRRQVVDLDTFIEYLTADPPNGCGLAVGDLMNDLSAWQGCEFGLIDGFKQWMLQSDYSLGTINIRLATVKRYCSLACQAGYITPEVLAMIKEVKGYISKEKRNVDKKREVTRRDNAKKAQWTHIEYEQAKQLKHLDNPRDALLMCLLLDHGLRVSEVSDLTVQHFDLTNGQLLFYRRKVDKTQTHKLTKDTLAAARTYLASIEPHERLFVAAGENQHTSEGAITGERAWSVRAINRHVGVLGRRIGIENLSPHDCRHYWATRATKMGTHVKALQQAGGWNSPYMPLRYAEEYGIANEGVKL